MRLGSPEKNMQNPLYKKPEDPSFDNPSERKKFTEETKSSRELLQKELNVNQVNQNLLQKRIRTMKAGLNDISSDNPQYSIMAAQIQMDNIELDELKIRAKEISNKLEEI